MCQFNLLVIDKSILGKNLKDILHANGFGYREINNESLFHQLGKNKGFVLTTKGACDCGSIIGKGLEGEVMNTKLLKKLRLKGWSGKKIERYLSDRMKDQAKKEERDFLGSKLEENSWFNLTKNILKTTTSFEILTHQFGGLIEEEEIAIEKTNHFSLKDFQAENLRFLKENQLYQIKKN